MTAGVCFFFLLSPSANEKKRIFFFLFFFFLFNFLYLLFCLLARLLSFELSERFLNLTDVQMSYSGELEN